MAFPRLFNDGPSHNEKVLSIQQGILDATQASAKAAAYQSEQMTYQSELLDTMVSAIRSLQRAIVAGIKVGQSPLAQNGSNPQASTRKQQDAPEQLTRVVDKNGKVMWKNSQGQFASKAAAEQKERDHHMFELVGGIALAVAYMNEKISEQTEMLDTLVRAHRNNSNFLKAFARRVSDASVKQQKVDAQQENKDLQDEAKNDEGKPGSTPGAGMRRRGGGESTFMKLLDGLSAVVKGMLIPLFIGFADGLDKTTGWIGKLASGFETLCGWIGDAITGFNKWFSGDATHEGVFNKWMDHVHDVFAAIADFDPREVIKKILTSLPASVQKIIPDALLKYAGMGAYEKKEETVDQSVERKNRENVVGTKFENKFDASQQKQWNDIGAAIKKQGYATSDQTAALNKIVSDSRGFLGRTFGSDQDQQRYVNAYTQQMTLQGKYQQTSDKAIASNGIDMDALWKKLSPEIAKGESGAAGYNAHHGGPIPGLTDMTIDQINKTITGAVGKYQLLPKTTLLEAARWAGLKLSDKFSPENQEKMGRALFEHRVRAGASGGAAGIQKQLSMEWASLPKDASGAGYYDGDSAGNKASGGAARAATIGSDIASSVTTPTPSTVSGASSSSGADLSATNASQQQQASAAPVVAAPVINNVNNSQTVNQAPASATTPAEFRSHV
jgi:hypothetical protein